MDTLFTLWSFPMMPFPNAMDLSALLSLQLCGPFLSLSLSFMTLTLMKNISQFFVQFAMFAIFSWLNWVLCIFYQSSLKWRRSQDIIIQDFTKLVSYASDVKSHHLIKVLFARFLYYKITSFTFIINKYLGETLWDYENILFLFHWF